MNKGLSEREKKKLQTQEKLFSNAIQLIQQQGYERTSVQQITKKANVGKGTFYNYFPSKESVVLEFNKVNIRRILESSRQKSSISTLQKLEEFVFDWVSFLISDYEIAEVVMKNRVGRHQDLTLHNGLQAILNSGQKLGEINSYYSAEFLARTIEGMIIEHIISWLKGREEDLFNMIQKSIQLIYDGLSKNENILS